MTKMRLWYLPLQPQQQPQRPQSSIMDRILPLAGYTVKEKEARVGHVTVTAVLRTAKHS